MLDDNSILRCIRKFASTALADIEKKLRRTYFMEELERACVCELFLRSSWSLTTPPESHDVCWNTVQVALTYWDALHDRWPLRDESKRLRERGSEIDDFIAAEGLFICESAEVEKLIDVHGFCDLRRVTLSDLPAERTSSIAYILQQSRIRRGITRFGHMVYRHRLIKIILEFVAEEVLLYELRHPREPISSLLFSMYQVTFSEAFYWETHQVATTKAVVNLCAAVEVMIGEFIPTDIAHLIIDFVVWDEDTHYFAEFMLWQFCQRQWNHCM